MPDDSLSIMDMLMLCLRHWPWFILSLFICMGAATLYLLSTPKTYTRTTSILVKSSGEKSNDIKLIEDLGVNNITSNISDEIAAIHSPAVVYDLVKRLHLNFSYYHAGYFRDEPLYAESLPVEVELPDLDDNATASFTLTLNGDETATLSEIVLHDGEKADDTKVSIGKKCKTPLGEITIKPTLYYKKGTHDAMLVRRVGFTAAASRYGSLISAALQPNTRNIIDITCVDHSIPRAENILKTIVNIYNENWVKNRNQVSVSTNEFIKERLAVIEDELGHVEGDIAAYKSSRGMLSVEQAAGQAISKEATSDAERQAINNQLYMIRYVRNYVSDPSHAKQLMPASTGIGNAAIEAQIAEYNTRILERNNLVSNSSERNPLVGDMDINLGNLRSAIMKSLDNAQTTLNAQLSSVQAVHGQALSQLSAAPQQQNHLLSFERQQKVKESLYLFLLQKREENELSQAFTAYNTRIIADPWGSSAPTSPDQNRILMMAFAIALALPAAFFIIRETSNSKVRGRKDLENLTIPYMGELPLWKPKKGEATETTENGYRFVVRQHSRDITNEAYRVVRTNLEFMTNEEKQCKVIMLTSFNPGSGKTFITANLGASFAIRDSRVICIDLDLRRGSLSEYAGKPKTGLTNYLSGQLADYHDVIVHQSIAEGKDGEASSAKTLDILPIGKIPPNPTELLYSPKLKPMIDELRQHYDYIFVDCPPVEIVADATIISREADVTIFVVRAGLLERSMLPELQKNYDEKKYKNMAILLNGTDAEHHYGYHRYGYGYGRYGYGKRYGYGYYGHEKK
ncbi:MAG: polysaccharide biosynthesis tyrosine autokinase [Prevotella sp.]|nr:polysaccharide biosynthesis tyrosine autokinase [Prevotella sp.]